MTAPLIASISVNQLFGLYSYRLPQKGPFFDANILYGDNGVGKSTILKMVFHMLSSAGDKGHRTALYNTQFESLIIELSSGVTFSATRRNSDKYKILVLEVKKRGKPIAIWNYLPSGVRRAESRDFLQFSLDDIDTPLKSLIYSSKSGVRRKESTSEKASVPEGQSAYLAALTENAPTIFILNAERRLDSDAVPDLSDEMELRRLIRADEPKRIKDLVVRSREIALSQALGNAAKWITQRAFKGANQGATNVHSVYGSALRYLLAPRSQQSGEAVAIQKLIVRLAEIERQTAEFARYDLQTPLSTAEFRKALQGKKKNQIELAAGLLEPYVQSLEARTLALLPLYRTVDRFVKIINKLLGDKSVSFQMSQGFSISNRLGARLEPPQLSSGEQQLLLLFCYVLTAREKPSVFMIDEPEISLNVKWQRQLVNALLEITEEETIQFVFASHSLELLTQHRDRVVPLVNQS